MYNNYRNRNRKGANDMKIQEKNQIREEYLEKIMELFQEEDLGKIASNGFNMPLVTPAGEEYWLEVVVKIPKDQEDEGYLKREEYKIKIENKKQKEFEKQKKLEKKKGK